MLELPLAAAAMFSFPGFDGLGLLEAGLDPRLAFVGSRKPLGVVVPRVPFLYRRSAGSRGSPFGGYYLIWLCPTCLNVGQTHAIFPTKKGRRSDPSRALRRWRCQPIADAAPATSASSQV